MDDSDIATHGEPVWRGRTNFIARIELSSHDMPGRYEQLWTRTEDHQSFELCCIPFFPYGMSLGDILRIDRDSGSHKVISKGGHRTIRFAFGDDRTAHEEHEALHGAIVGDIGCLMEFHSPHYGAIDLLDSQQDARVIAALTPFTRVGSMTWEWADPEPASDARQRAGSQEA